MKFYIYTFGCKVNTYESEAVAELLEATGRYEQVFSWKDADAVIVNSCAVTEESEKKAAKLMRRIRRENPDAVILLAGCMTQTNPEKGEALGADIVCGNTGRSSVPALLDKAFEGGKGEKKTFFSVGEHKKGEKFELLAPRAYKNLTRANLKIEDGCDCFCTYCIIPYARGRVRSMHPEDIKRAAGELVNSGHREIVLTGINIGMYGTDIGFDLADAAAAVRSAGAERIRLSSLEIDAIDGKVIEKLASVEGLCRHFHASLQSGSDEILKKMNRRYDTEGYFRMIERIRECFENASITTDIIVGFPGETDRHFNESVEFAKKAGFYRIHVFPYSRRKGTVADRMPNQVPEEVKRERAAVLAGVAEGLGRRFLESQRGTVHSVLFETKKNGLFYGHTGNYIYVKTASTENLKNEIRDVVLGGMDGDAAEAFLTEKH
ncbi:MAG: tRNA (N(6)-L-threonylcarbamoyladenosine(37)-C(2))-methylthiotransferase MtaB [Clostridia bacterium]|nr:tRNA (N(6)-L-threonylcarbamoyladenosine(37)-C(2))-methylthiotransferase MtaB [Clostridia bacterium]